VSAEHPMTFERSLRWFWSIGAEMTVTETDQGLVVEFVADGRVRSTWLADDATAAEWRRAETGPAPAGFIYRRPGVPFPHIVCDGYVRIGNVAMFVDGRFELMGGMEFMGSMREMLVPRLLRLGARTISVVEQHDAMRGLADCHVMFANPRLRPPPEHEVLIATNAPPSSDPDGVRRVTVPFYACAGPSLLGVVRAPGNGAAALAHYRRKRWIALLAKDIAGLYERAAMELPSI